MAAGLFRYRRGGPVYNVQGCFHCSLDSKGRLTLPARLKEAVKAHEVGLLDSFPGIARLDVLADETVEPGGCIARTDTTDVDARVDTLLAQVLDSLTG